MTLTPTRSHVNNMMNAERSIGIIAEQLKAYFLANMEVTFCQIIFQGVKVKKEGFELVY